MSALFIARVALPSDEALIKHFGRHRGAFGELRSMMHRDVNVRELSSYAQLSNGVFRMLDDPEMIVYPLSVAGLITDGWDKGIAYMVTPPRDSIVESLAPPKSARGTDMRRYPRLREG